MNDIVQAEKYLTTDDIDIACGNIRYLAESARKDNIMISRQLLNAFTVYHFLWTTLPLIIQLKNYFAIMIAGLKRNGMYFNVIYEGRPRCIWPCHLCFISEKPFCDYFSASIMYQMAHVWNGIRRDHRAYVVYQRSLITSFEKELCCRIKLQFNFISACRISKYH